MKKGRVYNSDYPGDAPDWYWINGLHDACVTMVDAFEFPFDFNRYAGKKNSADRNLLLFQIDASGALYDNGVKEIRFFNCKIMSEEVDLSGRQKVWWLSDRLTKTNGKYVLEIDMQDFDSFPKEFTFKIKFERAEVIRD